MKKLNLQMFAFAFAVTVVSTNANAESTLQEDIDKGAVPLTTSELNSVLSDNTQVGENWFVYNMADGNRIVAVEGHKTKKRKWWIDAKKGFCSTRYKDKKKICGIVYRIGQDEYRVYDKNGKETFTFTMEQGDTQNLN